MFGPSTTRSRLDTAPRQSPGSSTAAVSAPRPPPSNHPAETLRPAAGCGLIPRGPLRSAPGRSSCRPPRAAAVEGLRRAGRPIDVSEYHMAARRPSTLVPSTLDNAPTFAGLGVPARLVTALTTQGILTPFPIQTATLPDSLSGRDVLGRGRTGSGKTYAFALPVLARLATGPRPRPGRPRALILAPTRELAGQIEATLTPLAKALSLRIMTVYGGVRPGPQISGLRSGVDVLIACPGRLADHIEGGHARLDEGQITVPDEGDHMGDLGFLPAVTKLLDQTPRHGQRLLFSATLDAGGAVPRRRRLPRPAPHHADP